MRLEKHDLEVLLPEGIRLLSKNGNLNVQRMNYQLDRNRMNLQANGTYGGLSIGIDLAMYFFVKGGALGITFEKGYLDSMLMKGDILPFIKAAVKNHPNFCIEENTLYFYHPKMVVDVFSIDKSGIELTFK